MLKMIEQALQKAKIENFGFCDLSEFTSFLSYHGKEILPEKGSVIVVDFPYKVTNEPPKNISRYAAVPDYHAVCGKMLKEAADLLGSCYKENQFFPFIDHSPIPEVYAAVCAGLGIRGKNGLLITPKYGSYVFIGEIVTDLILPLSKKPKNPYRVNCLDCGKCEEACPGGSMTILNKTTCLSCLTQQKQPLSVEQQELLKQNGCVWGCDKCQEICPHNKAALKTGIKEFVKEYRSEYTPGESLDKRAYAWRGKAVIERNAELLKERNSQ